MDCLGLRAGAVAALLTLGLASVAPAGAVASTSDPRATTATGACHGGPGQLSLTVLPPVAGEDIEVRATARGLAAGSRWAMRIEFESGGGGEKDFRRVAVGGGWTVATQMRAPTTTDSSVLVVSAHQRGAPRHGCFVLTSPASPEGGAASCDRPERLAILLAREQDDGSVLVRSLLFEMRPGSSWHLTLAATGAGSDQTVQFDDYASRRGTVRSRVVIEGVVNPRLRLSARSENGGRCLIGLNPANVTTGEQGGLRDILTASRRLQ